MTKRNVENRELAIEKLEIVAGGVIEGGCFRLPDLLKILFPKPLQPTPWKDIFPIR